MKLLLQKTKTSEHIWKTFLGVGTALLIFSMLSFPHEVFNAALRGLHTWLEIVLPSLLPFFVVSELLLGLGMVHFLGVLLEPIMRPLFNLPGSGAFIMAIGFTSGAPIGASFTAELRQKNLCTRLEAEKIIAFTNNASPLFLFVAVAVGMFNDPSLGIVIAGAHYSANLILGILLRFYGRHEVSHIGNSSPHNLLYRAIEAMQQTQLSDRRPLGKLMADALSRSISKLSLIGGYIILFSVLITLGKFLGLFQPVTWILNLMMAPLEIHQSTVEALTAGLLEMTIGSKLASECTGPLTHQIATVSAILGWAGLSIHAQVASMVSETDIRMRVFVFTRLAHGLLAALLSTLFLKVFSLTPVPVVALSHDLPAFIFYRLPLTAFGSLFVLAGFILFLDFLRRKKNPPTIPLLML